MAGSALAAGTEYGGTEYGGTEDGGIEKGAIAAPSRCGCEMYLSPAYGHVSGPKGTADFGNALVFG